MLHYQPTHRPQRDSHFDFVKKMFGWRPEQAPSSDVAAPMPAYEARSDAQIEQDVKDEILLEPSVRAAAISVHAKDGVVALTGTIDGAGEQWLIEKAARRIAGVKSLSATLTTVVTEAGERTDEDIAHECENVLGSLTPQSNDAIRVMVTNGWVTLLGMVSWGYERWAAEAAVSGLSGVRGVNSQLEVRSRVILNDVDATIEAAMRGQKEGYRHTIKSTVDRDRVTLTGTVHSLAERRAALNAAWSSAGVKQVFDRMVLL